MCANCFSRLEVVVGQVAAASILLKRPVHDVLADFGVVAPIDDLGDLAYTVSFLDALDLDATEILGADAVAVAATWTHAPSRRPFALGATIAGRFRRRQFA